MRDQVRGQLGDELRDRLDSMDVTQDVLLHVTRDRDSFRGPAQSFAGWVAAIVRNRIRNLADYHRARRRDLRRDQHDEPELLDVPGATMPVDDLAQQELCERLRQVLAGLDDATRHLIELRSYQGCSWSEVAARTGRASPDAARVAYARALTELMRCLERPQPGDGSRP